MAPRFNPLLHDKRPVQPQKTLTASNYDDPPPSPFGGKPMQRALCRDTPVYYDAENRIVVPILKRS